MKHITFTTSKWLQMRIAVFFLLCLLCICLPTHSHAQTTRKKWKALKAQADTLEKHGKYEEALPLRIQEKDLALQKWGKWSKEYGTGAYDLGKCYYYNKHIDSAYFYSLQGVEINGNFNKTTKEHAESLFLLAFIKEIRREYTESISLYKDCLEIRSKILGKTNNDYIKCLFNLALVYEKIGLYKKAIETHIECLEIRRKLGKQYKGDYATSLNAIGLCLQRMGYHKEALFYLKNSLMFRKEVYGEKDIKYLASINNLILAYQEIAYYDDAIKLFKEYSNIRDKFSLTKDKTYFTITDNMAIIYSKKEQYAQSLILLNECLDWGGKFLTNKDPQYLNSLTNMGIVYAYLGNLTKSLELHKKCLELRKKTLPANDIGILASIMNIGSVYSNLGKQDQALYYYHQAIAIMNNDLDGKNGYYYSFALNNIGNIYRKMSEYDKALDFCQKSLTIREGISNIDCIKSLINISEIYGEIGNNTEKKRYLNQAKNLADICLSKNSIEYANIIISLAFLNDNTLMEAYQLFNKAIPLYSTHYLTQSSSLSESDRSQFWATLKDNYETYHSFCLDAKDSIPEVVAQAYNNQLNTAGILLQGTEKVKQAIQSSGDSSLLKLYETWRIQKKQIANWTTWDSLRLANSGIDLKVEAEKANDWEQELARKSVEFREATDTTAITWQQVQQSLQAGEAAVEIVRFRKYNNDFTDTVYYAALVLTPETKENPIYVFLPNGNNMDSLWFKEYRRYIDNHSKTNHIEAEDAVHYVRYLKAILAASGNAKHIYFAADGVYHKLNLNTLWTEQGQYVAQQWQIHQLSSTRELVKKHRENPVPTQFTAALFGNPTFDINKAEWLQSTNPYHQTENISTFRGGLEGDREENLKALPGAEAEVQAVGELLKNKGFEVKSYLNKMALEEEVQALKSPTIVLFATHGSFQKKASLPKSTGYNIANDPMYQSVLFFAGAKNTLSDSLSLENILATPQHEDGILHAAEAANLRLEGTELVVLSACETGLGQIQNGEGVYGLQRAFRIAGAKDLLMSLWKVDDQASKEFTTLFFQNWIDKKMAKYEAYRSTQLTLIQKYPHEPKKWGAFVLKESGR